MAAADRGFALIKSEEKKILDNMSLSTIEKTEKVLIVRPTITKILTGENIRN